MSFIRTLKDGKSQIMKTSAFCTLTRGVLPDNGQSISKLFANFDAKIMSMDKTVTGSALSNVHGDWYEWLLAIAAWNFAASNSKANLALLTPNISQFKVSRLYNDRINGLIEDLKEKVLNSSDVQLISSNPDFVILDRKLVNRVVGRLNKIEHLDEDAIHEMETVYKKFIGQCDFKDIKGYIACKTSFRPDRRLQIPHEGSLMKAIYTHIQTREWIINPPGLKYYAVATLVGIPDRTALKTVATHSITTVHNIPEAAVDEVFQVNSLFEAQQAYETILMG